MDYSLHAAAAHPRLDSHYTKVSALTVRLRMQAAELAGQSAERLRLARAALCRLAPLRLRSPTDLLHAPRLVGANTLGHVESSSPVCSASARRTLGT